MADAEAVYRVSESDSDSESDFEGFPYFGHVGDSSDDEFDDPIAEVARREVHMRVLDEDERLPGAERNAR